MDQSESQTTNEWKETVRKIYEACIMGTMNVADILDLIEDRHHSYFCEGKPL